MQLTNEQAKEKLHCGDSTLHALRDAGILHDLKERKNGAKKHFSRYDSVQVGKVAKYYKPRMTVEALQEAMTVAVRETAAGPALTPPASTSTAPTPPKAKEPIAVGVLTRLDRIEQLLNTLVKMWT